MEQMSEITKITSAAAGDPAPRPEYDRKPQFAKRAAVSLRCVDNWIRDRRIPILRVGRTVLIPWREALDTLNRNYRLNARSEGKGQL